MKKLIYLFKLLVICGTSSIASAQTSVEIYSAGDTLDYHCGVPDTVEFYINGITSGYSPTDSITVQVDFGDGTTTQFKAELYSDYFYTVFNHVYTTGGTFSTQYIVTGPDNNSDTLYIANDVTIDAACTGYISIVQANASGFQCNTSTPNYFYVYGNAYNYSSSDSINVKLNFGDGNNASFYTPVYSGDYFYANYTYTYAAPGVYTTEIIVIAPDGKSDTLYGQMDINNSCASLMGTVYIDNNNDCVFNAGDVPKEYVPVQLKSGSSVISTFYTDSAGNYYFNGTNGNTYTVELYSPSSYGYTPNCPASGSVTFTASSTNTNNFAVTCDNANFDLKGYLSGWGFRPGTEGYIYVWAYNNSCAPVNGTATLTLDPLLTYSGPAGGDVPTSVSGNTITWDFSNASGYTWYSDLYSTIAVSTSTSAQIGDSVCLTLTITPTSGDSDPSNNTMTQCFEVRNSCDPNMIQVTPKGIGASGDVQADTELTYQVHFQNTGNDAAYNIHIMDTIDADLDMSTLRIISSSHPMTPYILPGNVVKFDFPNIMLADSFSNEPESHGVVVYKIQMNPSLAVGTEIKNTAHIYFDFNAAVITNTALNTIAAPLAIRENQAEGFSMYPNPTKGLVNLDFSENFARKIIVRDILSKIVFEQDINSGKIQIDLSKLPAGFYTISANDGKKILQNKIMVNH
jgi:uncharacterized repeat protein (TIGR01451 family)